MWPDLTKPGFHFLNFEAPQLHVGMYYHAQIFISIVYKDLKRKCKISKIMALFIVALQLFEVEELDVCGSLVFSNLVTYALLW